VTQSRGRVPSAGERDARWSRPPPEPEAIRDAPAVPRDAPFSEPQRLLVQRGTHAEPPGPCVHRLIEAQVARTPDAQAVRFEDRALSYAQLDARANAVARRLRERAVGPDVLTGICVQRSVEAVVGVLGILKAGGAYVPLDPTYPRERLAFMVRDAGISVLVTDDSAFAAGLGDRLFIVELGSETETARVDSEDPETGVAPENLAYVIYTSGSTGRPKGVQVPHRALVNLLRSVAEEPGLDAGDSVLGVTSFSFDMSVMDLCLPLILGARLDLVRSEVAASGPQLRDALETLDPTLMHATPTTWRMLLEAGWEGSKRLKVICGGEAVPRSLADELLARSGALWNMYGPTETAIYSALHRVQAGPGVVPIGRPLAGTVLRILDERNEPVPAGSTGLLHIGGEGLARGYRDRPDLTAERFIPDAWSAVPGARLYATGDLARALPDGEIDCLGRIDHQVKVRGFRIELGEIEEALYQLPGVREAAVVAWTEGEGEKTLVAYVVGAGGVALPSATLRAHLQERLPEHMVPSAFVPLGRLPRTPNGKVDRRALPDPRGGRQERDQTFVPPRNAVELKLAKIWQKLFRLESIGIRDDFFELGGHSLIAGRLFGDVLKTFGRNLPPPVLLRAPTIEKLAILLEGERDVPRWSSLVPIQVGGSRPPLFCLHAGAGTILYYSELARELGPDQPVYGLQAQGLYGEQPPHGEVEEMAACYAREIRSVQPEGPYFLVGFCFGGLLAFAVSQQLHREGSEVALLATFDAGGPGFDYKTASGSRFDDAVGVPGPAAIARTWISHHARKLRAMPLREKLQYLNRKGNRRLGIWKRRLKVRLNHPIGDFYRKLGKPLPERVRHTYFRSASDRAAQRYAPTPYPGRMVVFENRGLFRDTHVGWDGWVGGGLEIHEIEVGSAEPGRYHAAFIAAVAAPFREILRAASERSEPPSAAALR
jgi:amino acid adenylation domain-containing protein